MALRIGCDMDGVLADMDAALAREAAKLFGAAPRQKARALAASNVRASDDVGPPGAADNTPLQHRLDLTDRERRQLWRHVRNTENFWEMLDETEPGIVARLAQLAAERRWEIIFLTRRPVTAGATAQVQSQRWLEAKGFRLPSVYVVSASRGMIAAGLTLDIVIDDTPENCVDVASDSKARTIAVFRDRELAAPAVFRRMGIHLVRTTAECLELLIEIDASLTHSEPGTMSKVMRSLGLKQQANA
jgi:hypothetical protein